MTMISIEKAATFLYHAQDFIAETEGALQPRLSKDEMLLELNDYVSGKAAGVNVQQVMAIAKIVCEVGKFVCPLIEKFGLNSMVFKDGGATGVLTEIKNTQEKAGELLQGAVEQTPTEVSLDMAAPPAGQPKSKKKADK